MKGHAGPRHDHAWRLADGTGLHAPPGELLVDDEAGRLCCHLCGEWFRSLGAHVRSHGHTAETYRAELGLARREPLTHAGLSEVISARQKQAYEASEPFRERLAQGQQDARSGELSRRAAAAREQNPPSPGTLVRQTRALEAGRATTATRRQAALNRLLLDSGSDDLPAYLRSRYAQGASLAQLARETGLGRSRLRHEMSSAAIQPRGSGQNTPDGRRSRARTAEAAAARRIGTDDLPGWLRARRDEGWTLAALGAAVGHSGHWVRWRLEGGTSNTSHSPLSQRT